MAHDYKLSVPAVLEGAAGGDVGMADVQVSNSALEAAVENYRELCDIFGSRSLEDRVNELLLVQRQ